MSAGDDLVAWYRANRRDLPWRRTSDPYAIWVSEVMLQQTQVQTVVPYWERWMGLFPTVESLAAADIDDVLSAWQGLGYYRRARNLQAGALYVVENGMPATRETWKRVPGVGDYTSGAIASIAFGERVAVVDGNVERVYARIAADPSSGSELKKKAGGWAQGLIEAVGHDPGDINQAMMELGATVCMPREARCDICPILSCRARDLGRALAFPTSEAKPATVRLTRYVLGYVEGDQVALERIPEGEWAGGMWQLPWRAAPPEDLVPIVGKHVHAVTHHRITLHILRVPDAPEGTTLFSRSELPALPSPQRKAIAILFGD